MLLDSIRSFFKPKKKDPESFYSMVQSTQWKSFIGKDEIKMIKGVIEVSELATSERYNGPSIKYDRSRDIIYNG